LPEALVLEGGELAVTGKSVKWLLLPDCVVSPKVISHTQREDEEPAIDPGTVATGFFLERGDSVAIHVSAPRNDLGAAQQ